VAAGNTYVAIATQTLGSNALSLTFSSIPSTYTDLVVAYSAKSTSDSDMTMQFNGDTGSNYSNINLSGTGTTALSAINSNQTKIFCDSYGAVLTTNYNATILHIMNYANTTTYKTILSRSSNADLGVDAIVGLWRSTAAINSITLDLLGASSIVTGSIFTIYGIKAA
jgi:hypothetical protein